MNKIFIFFLPAVFAVSCIPNNSVKQEVVRNERGVFCEESEGYQWSSLDKNCIRPFMEGVKLNPQRNTDSVAYLIRRGDRIELFSRNLPQSIILIRQTPTTWTNGGWKVQYGHNTYTVLQNERIIYNN